MRENSQKFQHCLLSFPVQHFMRIQIWYRTCHLQSIPKFSPWSTFTAQFLATVLVREKGQCGVIPVCLAAHSFQISYGQRKYYKASHLPCISFLQGKNHCCCYCNFITLAIAIIISMEENDKTLLILDRKGIHILKVKESLTFITIQ